MTELLSQEEIDALLKGSIEASNASESSKNSKDSVQSMTSSSERSSNGDIKLSDEEVSQLSEVAKLSLGATSSVVQLLLNKPVELNLSQLRAISYKKLAEEAGSEEYIIAKIAYIEGFDGNTYLLLKKRIAAIIGDLMMGGDGQNPEFQEMHMSAVGEMLNQMMGKTTTSLSEIFKKKVDIAPPTVELVDFSKKMPEFPDFYEDAEFLRIGFTLKIGDIVETEMVQLLAISFAQLMASQLAKPQKPEPKKAPPPPPGPIPISASPAQSTQVPSMGTVPPIMPNIGMQGMPGMPGIPTAQVPGFQPQMQMPNPFVQTYPGAIPTAQSNAAIPNQPPYMGTTAMPGFIPGMVPPQMPQAMPSAPILGSPAEFGMLQMPPGLGLQSNIDLLLDVPLQVTVELGRTKMLIKDVLELGIGSVVELNKLAGEAVEVYVNNKLIAKGEVVVIDENFAVRITSIVNPQDRLHAL